MEQHLDFNVNVAHKDIVQSAESRPRTECRNAFNLDSSGHPARSRLNTCLTSCDGWRRTSKILPTSPNPVSGTFSAVEPLMYEFVSGSKLTPGTSSLRNWTSRAGLKQGVGARYKDMPAPGCLRSYVLRHCPTQLCFGRNRGRFCLTLYLCRV
jgi:hypothetical protein